MQPLPVYFGSLIFIRKRGAEVEVGCRSFCFSGEPSANMEKIKASAIQEWKPSEGWVLRSDSFYPLTPSLIAAIRGE